MENLKNTMEQQLSVAKDKEKARDVKMLMKDINRYPESKKVWR